MDILLNSISVTHLLFAYFMFKLHLFVTASLACWSTAAPVDFICVHNT